MIQTVICDRCKKPIRPPDASRIGMAISADSMSIVHIPGYDGAYADQFAYADLCPECSDKFRKFMEGDKNNGNE